MVGVGGEGLHLDGVQGKVKDGTLLWSKVPCFLSHHVVLESQRKQQRMMAGGCHENLAPTCQPRAPCSSPFLPHQSPMLKFPSFQATPSPLASEGPRASRAP